MQVLWAPWRMAYIGGPHGAGCIFCDARDTEDRRAWLVLRQDPAIVLFNRFPYTSGHLMVAPREHGGDLAALSPAAFQTLTAALHDTIRVLRDELHPDGLNVGMNVGAAAGAGVKDHVHWHIVPRWHGDTNFMSAVGETRVVSEDLGQTYERLLRALRDA
jgi:ATP adenylyltransferase